MINIDLSTSPIFTDKIFISLFFFYFRIQGLEEYQYSIHL